MVDTLQAPLPLAVSPWMAVLAVFLFFIAKGLSRTRLCGKDPADDGETGACFSIAVLGLGLLTYYMNRAVALNIGICFFSVVILLCRIVQQAIPFVKRRLDEKSGHLLGAVRGAVGVVAVSVLFALSVGTVISYGEAEQQKQPLKDTVPLQTLTAQIESSVPKDTPALGAGIPELYSILGWDTHYHLLDFSDMNLNMDLYRILAEELNQSGAPVFVTKDALSTIAGYASDAGVDLTRFYENNTVAFQTEYAGQTFCYYVPVSGAQGTTD